MLCKLVCGKKKVNIQAFLIESDREYDMIKGRKIFVTQEKPVVRRLRRGNYM